MMSKEKQIESCENCLHYSACLINGEYVPTPCRAYEDKASCRKQSEAEWISVEEMVPDCEQGAESKAVLFITKQGFMYTGYYGCGGIYHDRYFREYKNSTEGYDISSVTHWMPLPEPPDMKGGE